MQKSTKHLIITVLVFMVLLSTACSNKPAAGSESQASQTKNKDPLRIGAVISLTGPNSPLGVAEQASIQLLEKKVNNEGGIDGRPIKVIYEDDKSDNTEAVKVAKKLVTSDKVAALIGSTGSGASLGVAEYAAKEGVVLVSMAAANQITDPVRKGIFKTPHTDIHATKRMYQFLKSKDWKKVAVLHDSSAYGSGFMVQLKQFASEYGLQIVAEEKFGVMDPSMNTQLTKINSSGANVLIVAGSNPGPAIIAKEAKQLNLKMPIVSSHGSANSKFIELAGDSAEGVFMVAGKLLVGDQIAQNDPLANVIKPFAKSYNEQYKEEPNGFAGYGYDALNIIVEALRTTKGDTAKLADTIENMKVVGVTGEFQFSPQDHTGLKEDSMVMVEIKDKKFHLLQ